MKLLLKINLKLKKQIPISKKVQKMLQKVQKNKEINPKLRRVSPNKVEYMKSLTQFFFKLMRINKI